MRVRRFAWLCGIVVFVFLAGCGGGGNTPPPVAPLTITTTTLTAGTVNTAYSSTLSVTGGTAPYTWSVASGSSLPAGLTLSSGGVISGTPTAAAVSSFTVQVSDAESTPVTTSAKLSLAISAGPLQITSGSPPPGTVNAPFSFSLSATGGIPPYTWSLAPGSSPLPAGLTLSATGVISGTPTASGTSTPVVQVTDSTTTNSASTNITITINPAGIVLPQGSYSFSFSGTGPTGAVAINGTFLLAANQAIAIGIYDKNTIPGPPQAAQSLGFTTSSLSIGANGLGQMVLTLADGTKVTFALAAPTGIGSTGNDSDIRIIEFDDSTGTGTRGSGVLKFANQAPALSDIKGNYAFAFSGNDSAMNRVAIAGMLTADGAGHITGGTADGNSSGTLVSYTGLTGTYTLDSVGRGVFDVNLNGAPYTYSFYEVSPGELLAITADQVSATVPLVSGSVLQQTGTFSNASLNGVSALELTGVAQGSGTPAADLTLGLATTDGKGSISVSYDENKNGLLAPQTYTGTYTVNAASGRVAVTASGTPPIFYLVSNTAAFVLGTDMSASSGLLEAQTAASFTNASFKGNYLGGSVPLSIVPVTNAAGLVAADGNGNVVTTYNSSGPTGLQTNQTVTGTYTVDSHGRVVVTAAGNTNGIFYVVSPSKVVFLSGAANGYLGSFEQ